MDMEWNEEPMDAPWIERNPWVQRIPQMAQQGAGLVAQAIRAMQAKPRPAPRTSTKPRERAMYLGMPSISTFGAAMANAGGAAQGRHLGNMMGMTMGAINQENQSRVAQAREARRQQHEKDLMIMRLQGMNKPRRQEEMSPEMLAALEVLRMENEAGRSGSVKNRALRALGML